MGQVNLSRGFTAIPLVATRFGNTQTIGVLSHEGGIHTTLPHFVAITQDVEAVAVCESTSAMDTVPPQLFYRKKSYSLNYRNFKQWDSLIVHLEQNI